MLCYRNLLMGMLLAALLGTACSSAPRPSTSPDPAEDVDPNVVSFTDYNDPLMGINRAIFAFNDVSYRYMLIPAAETYMTLPGPARRGVGNFFHNLTSPVDLVNQLFQGRPGAAGVTAARFVVNTTVGVAGLFDPAAGWMELAPVRSSAGETLSRYGADYGFYLVLPLVGPSNFRDGSGMLVDTMLNPVGYLLDAPESVGVWAFDAFQTFAPQAGNYLEMRQQSDDPYLFMRNLHLQGIRRDEQQ